MRLDWRLCVPVWPESQWKHALDLKPHPHGAPLHACRVLRGYVAA